LVHDYRLRLQIEFNFRDAKQHWGLEDFMVTKEEAVLNAANFSLFMVNVSQSMLATSSGQSILDLKACYHGIRYAQVLFKILPKSADVINIEDWLSKIPILGRIHVKRVAA
jgi:putative transposase